jgi:hypothetical protein
MEVDMYDLNIAALSRIRHNDLLEDAENQRQCRKQQKNKHNPIVYLANRIRCLKDPLPNGKSQATPDQIAVLKS